MSFLLPMAFDHYSQNGYSLIDVPYIVDVDVTAQSKPDWARDLKHGEHKAYVGSGEQSFIQMMKEGKLRNGKSMCITPCFRDEETLDDLHLQMFLKVELIYFSKTWNDEYVYRTERREQLSDMIDTAYDFFSRWGDNITVINTGEDQYDICSNGIEVGSYGFRETEYGRLVYGTGLALPRFTQTLKEE